MACRRRWRLGSAALVVAAVLCESTPRSQESTLPVFESRPHVGPLLCPSQTSAAPARSPTGQDRIPTDEDLSGAFEAPIADRPLSLPTALVERFELPAAGERMRIGVWGDSHVAAGFITDELTKIAEAKGLRVDTRVIPASAGRPGVRLPIRKVCKAGWQFQPGYTAQGPIELGPSLSTLRSSRSGDYLWLDFRHRADRVVRGLRIHHLRARSRAAIGVRIDDGVERRLELGAGVIHVRASASISTMKLRALQGEVALQEIEIEYENPAPLTIDVFGLPSATVKGWSNAEPAYLKRAIGDEGFDAVVLEYGTNEGAVESFDPQKYAALLSDALRALREVQPGAACLLIGPTDRGVRIPSRRGGRPDLLRYARIHEQIARIQGRVGAQYGCVTWDWQRYMGGPGSMYWWARQTPALAAPDLIHLTPAGYRRTATALARSIGWLAP
jgi:lysophospholipase L1-like esterase